MGVQLLPETLQLHVWNGFLLHWLEQINAKHKIVKQLRRIA
jgi:hypothetical protein